MPEFIGRYRRRLATHSERYIALRELLMYGLSAASILSGFVAALLMHFNLIADKDPFRPRAFSPPALELLIILVLTAVFAVLFNFILRAIYEKWLFPLLRKKYPRWPDMP